MEIPSPPPPPTLQSCNKLQYAGGSKNENTNNADKYVPYISSHMHKDLHKCVGGTLVQQNTGIVEPLQKTACGECMCACESVRVKWRGSL